MRYLVLIVCLFLSVAGNADNTSCVFNSSWPSTAIVSNNPQVKSYIWNSNADIISALMTNGNLLFVKQWACTHLGLAATLFVNSDHSLLDQRYWINEILWLANQLLSAPDYHELQQASLNKYGEVKVSADKLSITVPDELYSEFNVTVAEVSSSIKIITLLYYFG